MGWWQTLMNFGDAPSPERPRAAVERWARPISFTLNVPAEMSEAGVSAIGPAARVTRDVALSVPAVKRGRDLICGTLGTLRLRQHDSTRKVVSSQLLEQPEPDVARSVTMTRTVEDLLFDAKAWWRITSFDGNGYPAQVRKLNVCDVAVQPDGRVFVKGVHVPDAELIRIDSPNPALLSAGATAIRAAHALARASSRYTNNPLPLGYFTPDGDVDPGDDEDIEDILDDFEDSMARRTWAYVGAGLKANPLQWSPEQLQLSGQRDYAVLEIARLMGVDPEELGVSTTSRTYANSESRRLDLIDFTLAAYVVAIEDRLSMPDVTVPGHYVRAEYGSFLRSDTASRMATYETGRRVGVYDDDRIGELEDVPTARVRAAAAAARPAPAAPAAAAAPRQAQEAAR